MKRIFDLIDAWPADSFGPVHFAPPTYIENLTGAVLTFILLLGIFCLIAGTARIAIWFWERREARRPRRFVRREL